MAIESISYSKESKIHIYALDTTNIRHFDHTPLMRATAWHPNGQQLAYGLQKVICLDLTTNEIELVSKEQEKASYPAWHPNGLQLLYNIEDRDRVGWLCVHNLSTNEKTYLNVGRKALQVDWHPDGETVAFVGIQNGNKHIFTTTIKLNEPESSLDSVQQITQGYRFDHAPAWSPSGQYLAFERYLPEANHWALMLFDLPRNKLTQLTDNSVNAHHPTWAGNGQRVAFEIEYTDKPSDIGVINLDGTGFGILLEDAGLEPAWYTPK